MSQKPAHWEKPPSILFAYDDPSITVPELDPTQGDNGEVHVLPEPPPDTAILSEELQADTDDPQTSSSENAPEMDAKKAWESLIFRKDIDAAKVSVHTSDAAKITGDRYSTQPQRASRIAHEAMAKLAAEAGIPAHLVAPAELLQKTYYEAASYLFNNEKRQIEVDVIVDLLDEGLAPILHNTPVPIVQRYVKLMQYRHEASEALFITKLWAADMYGVDLPYAYSAIRKLKRG